MSWADFGRKIKTIVAQRKAKLEGQTKFIVEHRTISALIPLLFGFSAGSRLEHIRTGADLFWGSLFLSVAALWSFLLTATIRQLADGDIQSRTTSKKAVE